MAPESDLEVAKTLSLADAPRPPPSPNDPPIVGWDRYELLELLGAGGMGSVYKARDRRLGRTIAIKFILSADPELTMRFLREARAQARIDHPGICRVYEVGEVQGRAYIALQFIAGEPLHKAAARMTLDDKVAVLRDVAIAIHEAHRLGIVHRDLKPANIMVERRPDGGWFAVVMDFGLAREATVEPSMTRSGALLGTPAYMAPEQARGDTHAVDRRSDIYSLGATLYELLTGQRPFSDAVLAVLLARVIHDEPAPPRSLVPNLPIDLETIALKCLVKDPAQRYPSARALGEDLGRYLDGEPIVGRRPSLRQRLATWARRRRAVVAVGAWSAVIVLVVAALGVRAWILARSERTLSAERTRLAERLGQEAKDIELFLRSAYQRPLHDTKSDREIVRARMRTIAATRHDLGELGDGIVYDALGRGHLALHQWREAADKLARAASAGRQTPALHAARGRALGELYHAALEDARRSDDKAGFARRQRELEQQYLRPVLDELEQGRASGEDADLLDALIARYRGDFATAEQRAREIAERAPWLFEARKLAADAANDAASAVFDRGDYEGARAGFERTAALYAEASDAARSDPEIYEGAALNWAQYAEADYRSGRAPREAFEKALDIIDRAVLADSDGATAYTNKAYVLLRWYRNPLLRGVEDQRPLLERIAQAAARGVELDPGCARGWDALASAHVFRGEYEASHGGQSAPWWQRALDELARALTISPNDPWVHNDLGIAHVRLGDHLVETGGDPMLEYRTALRSFERAAAINPQYLYAWVNQADLYTAIAQYESENARDPQAAVEGARRAGQRCLAIDSNYHTALATLAQAELALARYRVESGGDPSEALANMRGYLDRSDAIQPGSNVTWFYRVAGAGAEARFHMRDGGDPSSAVAAGRAALAQALPLAGDCAACYVEAVRFELVAAAAETTAHASAAVLAAARGHAEKAIALDVQSASAKLAAAEVYLQIATGQPTRAAVDRGIAYIDQALAINPRLPRAQAVRAALSRLSAR